METDSMKRICVVVSSELTVKAFLINHLRALSKSYAVTVVANTADAQFLRPYGIEAEVTPVLIERKPTLHLDMLAVWHLYQLFRRQNFDLIYSVTPKAGLLAMLAGSMARVPVRIHTFTGQVWVTRYGLIRNIFKTADRILVFFATHILVDSFSQRNFLLRENVISSGKSSVLARGSISGVDTDRFSPNRELRHLIRKRHDIPDDHIVFLYLGRLHREKGILDLAQAFVKIAASHHTAHLFIVGPDEENLLPIVRDICTITTDRLHYAGYTEIPEQYLACADVFCLPSYREGFGTVILEAAAAGLPAIGSRIYGITDAIEEGITGLLHVAGNISQLTDCMERYLVNPAFRKQMADTARTRALRDFPQEKVTTALLDFCRHTLQ
jgi:glycosyltransferase involved in cell wall biosynthesis